MNSLVKFWRECDLTTPPYIHPKDKSVIEKGTRTTALPDHRAFVEHLTFGNRNDSSLHVSLLPVPYQGNLGEADIFIVLLNPGLGLSDYQTQEDEAHSNQLRKIIAQDFREVDYPFLSLNPEYAWSGGFQWWEKKLRKIIRQIAITHCGNRYDNALKLLSRRLAAIEMFPYHSRTFKAGSVLEQLPSVSAAREFIHGLLPRAHANELSIIVTRSIRTVGIEDHALVNFDPKLVRSAPLGPETKGGLAIIEALKRRPPPFRPIDRR